MTYVQGMQRLNKPKTLSLTELSKDPNSKNKKYGNELYIE
jgi:hypothetical protein